MRASSMPSNTPPLTPSPGDNPKFLGGYWHTVFRFIKLWIFGLVIAGAVLLAIDYFRPQLNIFGHIKASLIDATSPPADKKP
jgi:hypothetical protein